MNLVGMTVFRAIVFFVYVYVKFTWVRYIKFVPIYINHVHTLTSNYFVFKRHADLNVSCLMMKVLVCADIFYCQ